MQDPQGMSKEILKPEFEWNVHSSPVSLPINSIPFSRSEWSRASWNSTWMQSFEVDEKRWAEDVMGTILSEGQRLVARAKRLSWLISKLKSATKSNYSDPIPDPPGSFLTLWVCECTLTSRPFPKSCSFQGFPKTVSRSFVRNQMTLISQRYFLSSWYNLLIPTSQSTLAVFSIRFPANRLQRSVPNLQKVCSPFLRCSLFLWMSS